MSRIKSATDFVCSLTEGEFEDLSCQVNDFTKKGLRVVVVFKCNITDDYIVSGEPTELDTVHTQDFRRAVFVGQFPLEEVREAIAVQRIGLNSNPGSC